MRTFHRNLILSVSLLALGGLLAICVAGCSSKQSNAQPPASSSLPTRPASKPADDPNAQTLPKPGPGNDRPQVEVKEQGVTITWPDPKGNKLMKAKAKEVSWDEVQRRGFATGFSAELFENGKLTATISAPRAEVDKDNQIVLATGGVTLKSTERKATAKAQWMKWYAKKHTVIGNGGVKISSPMWDTEGAAFIADTTLKTFTIKDSAKGLEP